MYWHNYKENHMKGEKLAFTVEPVNAQNSIQSSRAISRVNWFKYNVSGTGSVPILCLRMGTELVPETLYLNELTRLCAREDYIESCHSESFKTYVNAQNIWFGII
jgi:hypothetical protein